MRIHCRNDRADSWLVSCQSPNKPLVPTRNGEAPLLAAQRRRYVPPQQSL